MTSLPSDLQAQMVHRMHEAEGCLSEVWYSTCDRYRYGLSRVWDRTAPRMLFIMLNPSTADEHRNDPTVARCETRARRMGFGAVMVANIFAFRATFPDDLKRAKAPIGDLNDTVLEHWSGLAEMTIAAWGVHGSHRSRAQSVARGFPGQLHHLGLTKNGHPRHPLYVSFNTAPKAWPLSERYPQGQT